MRRRGTSSSEANDFPLYPIVPIIEALKGVTLGNGEGRGWVAVHCPFHPDSDASASINTTLQVFNCHAADCPKGNAVQVIMEHEGMTYSEANQRAAEIAGGDYPQVRGARGRRGGVSRKPGDRNGSRTFRRTWRSD